MRCHLAVLRQRLPKFFAIRTSLHRCEPTRSNGPENSHGKEQPSSRMRLSVEREKNAGQEALSPQRRCQRDDSPCFRLCLHAGRESLITLETCCLFLHVIST